MIKKHSFKEVCDKISQKFKLDFKQVEHLIGLSFDDVVQHGPFRGMPIKYPTVYYSAAKMAGVELAKPQEPKDILPSEVVEFRRRDLKLNQIDFAQELGISVRKYAKMENDLISFLPSTLRDIAQMYVEHFEAEGQLRYDPAVVDERLLDMARNPVKDVTAVELFRRGLKVSQKEFAVLARVSLATVRNWESGAYKPGKMALINFRCLADEYSVQLPEEFEEFSTLDLRQRLKLTQKRFANLLGVPLATVAAWEVGATPREEYMVKLRKVKDFLERKGQ